MYIPHRHYPKIKIGFFFISTIIIFWFITLYTDYHKVPFPRVPNIPAHIPFKREATWDPDLEQTAFSKRGMVASDSEYCSELGAQILRDGGNAADAAVTTCLCIGATDTMFSSGIGGGTFITSKNYNNTISIDAREMAPGAAYVNMFKGREEKSKYGGLASGIPGELKGLWTLYKLHGSGNIEWKDLVIPIADLIEKGWKIDKRLEFALQAQLPAFKYFRKDWDFVFKGNTNDLLEEGDIIRRPALAKTLRYVATHGAPAFYDSKDYIARSLAAKVQEWEGLITPEDFDMYDVVVENALKLENFTNENLTVYSANGASSGLALISGLSILNQLNDFGKTDYTPIDTHRLVEVMKWMAATRSYLGDVGIYNSNQTQLIDKNQRYNKFLSQDYINDVISKVNDNQTYKWEMYNPAYEPNDPHGTSSLSVADKDGNAVVLTTTINLLFGSCIHDPETGIIMNNEMDDFSVPHTKNAFGLHPSVYNYIQPYKRPLSSSAQSIIVDKDNNLELIIGAAGGSRITNAILQGIVRIFFQGKDLTNTIANPRIHHQLLPDNIYFEYPINSGLVDALESKGHKIEFTLPQSAMNAIRVSDDSMWGQSDWWRKFGVAVGV
jgi:gamma-glutamyltranspeptidase/glutathione hydrolase